MLCCAEHRSCAISDLEDPARADREASGARLHPPPVYLVGHDAVLRHSHECLFRALGRDVVSYDSLDSFLRQFARGSGWLCIDADGPSPAACLRLLRRRRARMPVVLLVGHLPGDYLAALGDLYAPLEVLTKPVSGRHLLEVAETLWWRTCRE